MLSIEQCRAARGLLGWTQQDLADASGLSKTAINNFEKGHSDIKVESLKTIYLAFQSADVEFFGQTGIRKKSEDIQILRGKNALCALVVDMYQDLQTINDDVLVITPDNSFIDTMSEQKIREQHEALKAHGIQKRVLCAEGINNAQYPDLKYRWIPKALAQSTMPIYIYGSKVAFELWDREMIIVIDSAKAHNAERKRFEYLWNLSLSPSGSKQKK